MAHLSGFNFKFSNSFLTFAALSQTAGIVPG